jgi:predicted Zn-dependent peptidase
MGRIRGLSARWTYNREYRTLEEDLAILEAITTQQLVEVAAKYAFAPMTVETLGPGAA